MAKFDGSGVFQWNRTYAAAGGYDQQLLMSMILGGGRVYLCGLQESAANGVDGFLAAYLAVR